MASPVSIEGHDRLKHKVSKRIKQLTKLQKTDSQNRDAILEQLSLLAKQVGVASDDCEILIDLIIANAIPIGDQKLIIKEILIPSDSTNLSIDLIFKIISQIGIPQVYHKDGRKSKLKRLSSTTQIQLLEWLVCSIHLFGEGVYRTLKQMLPILFNYLSYEYLRPYISNLIFLSVLNCGSTFKTYYNQRTTHRISGFKPWHVQLVVDLYSKFPVDEYLKSLLILFRSLDPSIDLENYAKNQNYDLNNLGPISTSVFMYPNREYLKSLKGVNGTTALNLVLTQNLKEYEEFDRTIKRRKRNKAPIQYEANIEFNNFDILAKSVATSSIKLQSKSDLVINLADSNILKVNELFQMKEAYSLQNLKKLLVILRVNGRIELQQDLLKRLNHYIKLSLIDDNLTASELNRLCDDILDFLKLGAGTLELSLVNDFILYLYDAKPIISLNDYKQTGLGNLRQRLKFLRYLPIMPFDDFKQFLHPALEILLKALSVIQLTDDVNILFHQFFYELILMFSIWISRKPDDSIVFSTIARFLPTIYDFLHKNHNSDSYAFDFSIIRLLRFVKSIKLSNLNQYFQDNAVVPPPALVYCLLMKRDAIYCSEICGFIAYTKAYQFKSEEMKALQNSYIMDTVNYIWRDKALNYDDQLNSSNRGFFFHPEFQTNISSLNVFNYSNLITLPTIGNFFVNPTWAYLSAQIVWKLEDEASDISTRHQGPVSKDSILRLQTDPDNQWLDINYDELKLKILRELDKLGFSGLADLLFNSLKTLQNQRIVEQVET